MLFAFDLRYETMKLRNDETNRTRVIIRDLCRDSETRPALTDSNCMSVAMHPDASV
jgi:hypothetical protein